MSGVSKEIFILFASTQLSDVQFSGWHAISEICSKIDLEKPELITATNNRHRIRHIDRCIKSTESERDLLYKHMGHSAQMDKEVYQAPLALSSATLVAPNLMNIEKGEFVILSIRFAYSYI